MATSASEAIFRSQEKASSSERLCCGELENTLRKRQILITGLSCTAIILGTVVSCIAQTRTGLVIQAAPIYLYPDAALKPLRIAAVDTRLRVKTNEGGWLKIEYQDPLYGRSEGYVLAKNIRLSEPALVPMDLSVKDPDTSRESTDDVQLVTEPAQPQATMPSDAVGRPAQTRNGLWFNAGMGFESLGCEDCGVRTNGLSGGLSLGGTISDRVLFGIGTAGWAKTEDGETFTVGLLDARVRVYPVRTSGFFLTGGVGLGTVSNLSYLDESEVGLGILLGVGWDVRVSRNVSLTPFWNGFAMSNSSLDANVGQFGIGITIH
jgi:hypothetical protein